MHGAKKHISLSPSGEARYGRQIVYLLKKGWGVCFV